MLAALTAFAITSAARLLTGARALWLGSTAQPTQRLYYANHSSHGDFVLLWASLPPELRKTTRPVAGGWGARRPPLAEGYLLMKGGVRTATIIM